MSESPSEQVLRARGSVGLVEDGGRAALLRVAGADRIPFLHRMLTCDVKGAPAGSALPGLLLTAKGKVLAQFLLAVLHDRVEIVAPAAARDALRDGLAKFVVGDDVGIQDRSATAVLLSLLGPGAGAAAERLLGGTFAGSAVAEASAAGVRVLGVRRTRSGLPAVDVVVDAAAAPAVRAAALSAAAAEGGGPLDHGALEVLRIEAGEPALGVEATEETLPQECGLVDHVSFTKGCFVGQEPVARLENRGHTNRGLAGLLLERGATLPARGDAVLAGEKEAGLVTSAAESPSLGRPVALALLRHEHATPGTRLSIRSARGSLSAEAAALPFVRWERPGRASPAPTNPSSVDS